MAAITVSLVLIYFVSVAHLLEPDGTVCFSGNELNYFCGPEVYQDAKTACENADSYLVKVDNANMTRVVESLIDQVKCVYKEDVLIGATASSHPDFPNDRSRRLWNWLDGSKVYLPSEVGYQNWKVGQPNDAGNDEDCLILDKYTRKWKDSKCKGTQEEKQYICQKDAKFHITVTAHKWQCVYSKTNCMTRIEWRQSSEVVSSNKSSTIYQTVYKNSAFLYHENATIGDTGKYICVVLFRDNNEVRNDLAVNIMVKGTPKLADVRSFACNSSLQVIWEPQLRALGFRHRIMFTKALTGELIKGIEETPYETLPYYTEVTGLEASTEYHVKVAACKVANNCTDEYAVTKSATTKGIVLSVTNARIQQNTNVSYSGSCIVTWQYNIMDTLFQITTHTQADAATAKTTEYNIFTKNTFYKFVTIPDQLYEVEIQVVTNGIYCSNPVKAAGLCVGREYRKITDQNNVVPVIALAGTSFVLLIVISILAFFLCKRGTATLQQATETESAAVHEYATVEIPEINNAKFKSFGDNSLTQSNMNVGASNWTYNKSYKNSGSAERNLSRRYENVTKQDLTDEYEM